MKLVSIHKPKGLNRKVLLLGLIILLGNTFLSAQVWSLDQCLDTAKNNNKKLQMSTNNILISNEKQREVKSHLLPKISLNGDYKYYLELPTQLMPQSVFGGPEGKYKEAQFGVPHNINASLQLAIPLYNPEVMGGIKATKIASTVSLIKHKKTEEQIFFDISNLYYNAQIIKSQIKFLNGNLSNSKKLLTNVQLLNKQLLAKKTDAQKVELQIQQIETKKMALNSKYLQITNGLKLLMGVNQEMELSIEEEIIKKEKSEYKTQSLLDIQLLDAKSNLLNTELKTIKQSRYLPTAFLYGSYGTMGYGYDETPNEFLNFYTMGFVGLKINYPIYSGGIAKNKIKQKNLSIQNNSLQKELITDQNNTLISNAKLEKSMAEESLLSIQKNIVLAENIYKNIILQQKNGLANLTDILLSDNAVREAQQNYIMAVINYLKADLTLKKLTGNISSN